MKTILTSELSRRATNNSESGGFATVISVSAPEGRSELLIGVRLESACGYEEKGYLVPLELLDSLNLRLADIPCLIDEVMLDGLCECDEIAHALHRAYGIISYGACSYRRLERKLFEKGVQHEIAKKAVEIVREKGYIDENYLALRACELCQKKFWGKSRILRKLRDDGYCDEAIEGALSHLDTVDFAEQCASLIEKRYLPLPSDRYEQQKIFASISRYGYSGSEIKEALKLFKAK